MRDRPSADVNSVMINPQPDCWLLIGVSTRCLADSTFPVKMLALRMKRRNTVSVTPAIGASTVAGETVTPPISTDAGTRAEAGMGCSRGLSQLFFMEIFFMAYAVDVSRSRSSFCGFLPRKTTPRDLCQFTVIAKLALNATKASVAGGLGVA